MVAGSTGWGLVNTAWPAHGGRFTYAKLHQSCGIVQHLRVANRNPALGGFAFNRR